MENRDRTRDFGKIKYLQPFFARQRPDYIGPGLQMLQRAVKQRRLGVDAGTDPPDTIFANVLEGKEAKLIADYAIRYPAAKIYVGGIGALQPYEIKKHCKSANIILGDYTGWLDSDDNHPSVFTTPDKTEICQGFNPNDSAGGLTMDDGSTTYYLSLGCKMRCPFCVPGTVFNYTRTNEDITLKKGDHLITNMLSADKYNGVLPAYYSDVFNKLDFESKQFIRIGIEGVSERIRMAVGKPISHADLCDKIAKRMQLRHKTRLFYIAGLPGETPDDWDECFDFISYISCITGGLSQFKFTAYQPNPYTPLSHMKYGDSYYELMHKLKSKFMIDYRSPHIDFTLGCKPENRQKNALAAWGGPLDLPSPYFQIKGIDKSKFGQKIERYKKHVPEAQQGFDL